MNKDELAEFITLLKRHPEKHSQIIQILSEQDARPSQRVKLTED